MMKDKSIEGKLKIIHIFHENGIFYTIYAKLVSLKQQILNEMNIQFIFDQLPVHPFDIRDIEIYKKLK